MNQLELRAVLVDDVDPRASLAAARLAGIRPQLVTFLVFVFIGALSGLAAMMNIVQSPQVQPLSGLGLELKVIAAAHESAYPAENKNRDLVVRPLSRPWTGFGVSIRTALIPAASPHSRWESPRKVFDDGSSFISTPASSSWRTAAP